MPANDVAFTGSWTLTDPAEYEVSYSYRGVVPTNATAAPGTEAKEYNAEVSVNTTYAEGATVTDARGEWTFSGWSTSDAEVTNGSFRMPANNVAFTGSWTLTDPAEYEVSYSYRGTVPTNANVILNGKTYETENEAEVAPVYTLTIYYQYADGTTAAPAVQRRFFEGDVYTVTSPTIEGYNSSYVAVTGTMPNRDVVVTVVYSAPTTPGGGGGGGGTTPTPPTPPTPDGPNPIVVPDIPVPAAPGAVQVVIPTELVPVGDEEVPLQGAQIDVDEDGNVTVTPIDEEEIPLAGGENDEHACCILHFLLMLAALIIYTCFTHSMKKRQKKLAELKDQLAEETLKKQLGITDDRQAEM